MKFVALFAIAVALKERAPSLAGGMESANHNFTAETIDQRALGHVSLISFIEGKRDLIENYILISRNEATGRISPSTQYTYSAMIESLHIMGGDGFGADFKFMLWEETEATWIYGLVNLAAFLANCMVESIESDACDELNWQQSSDEEGMYALSNSCGQEGRNYADENCSGGSTEFRSCDVDVSMNITAVSVGTQINAPPPLTCHEGSGRSFFAGYWDSSDGTQYDNVKYPNLAGRTDVEGCGWWGRGALWTRGVCNLAKINFFLGKGGADIGRSTLYPTINFCQNPEVTCTSTDGVGERLRWDTAFFEWSERIQRYEVDGWTFRDQVMHYVDTGMTSDSFIDGVSRILTIGCHEIGCSNVTEARLLDKRRTYFEMIVNDVFGLESPHQTTMPLNPTAKPTYASISFAPTLTKPTTSKPSTHASTLILLEGNTSSNHRCTLELLLVTTLILLLNHFY